MTQNISEEDQKKICAMFFYLQDISLELQACSNILHQIKEKLEDSEENVLALATLSRVIFNYTVINVFKAGELIYNNQGFIKDYFPKSLEKLNKFKSEFWTNDLKNYRNKYVAHHSDKKKKEREDTSPFLSRGELLKLMLSKSNFLLLDEPTNHLDIESKEVLENAIVDYSGTVLIISHDRYFLNKVVNKIWYLEDVKITEFYGNYDYFLEKLNEKNEAEEKIISKTEIEKEKKKKRKKKKKKEQKNKN